MTMPKVITTLFIFISTLAATILGIMEKANLLMILICFILAIIYLFAFIKNLLLFIQYKKV